MSIADTFRDPQGLAGNAIYTSVLDDGTSLSHFFELSTLTVQIPAFPGLDLPTADPIFTANNFYRKWLADIARRPDVQVDVKVYTPRDLQLISEPDFVSIKYQPEGLGRLIDADYRINRPNRLKMKQHQGGTLDFAGTFDWAEALFQFTVLCVAVEKRFPPS